MFLRNIEDSTSCACRLFVCVVLDNLDNEQTRFDASTTSV